MQSQMETTECLMGSENDNRKDYRVLRWDPETEWPPPSPHPIIEAWISDHKRRRDEAKVDPWRHSAPAKFSAGETQKDCGARPALKRCHMDR